MEHSYAVWKLNCIMKKVPWIVKIHIEEYTKYRCMVFQVIVCGGGAKPRLVQKAISEYLSNAEVYNSIPPDEVIAIGAAKQVSLTCLFENSLGSVQENFYKWKVQKEII